MCLHRNTVQVSGSSPLCLLLKRISDPQPGCPLSTVLVSPSLQRCHKPELGELVSLPQRLFSMCITNCLFIQLMLQPTMPYLEEMHKRIMRSRRNAFEKWIISSWQGFCQVVDTPNIHPDTDAKCELLVWYKFGDPLKFCWRWGHMQRNSQLVPVAQNTLLPEHWINKTNSIQSVHCSRDKGRDSHLTQETRCHSVWKTTLWTSFWSSGPLNQHVYYPTLATVMTKIKSVVSRNLALNTNATLRAVRLTGRVFKKPNEFMSKQTRRS